MARNDVGRGRSPVAFTAVLAAAVLVALPAPPAEAQVRVQCGSRDYRYQHCPVAGPLDGAWLVQQRSGTPCEEGRSWGWDRRGVWVDRGCEGIFEVQARVAPAPVAPPRGLIATCESRDYRYEFCEIAGDVVSARLVAQRSQSACIEGRTWGSRANGIWVSGGCAADFEYRIAEAPPPVFAPPTALLYCESRDYRYTFCPTGRLRGAELVNQRSQAQCAYGTSWGYQDDGVWVDRGCAAEFALRLR